MSRNKAVHAALGARTNGAKGSLGQWLERNEAPGSVCRL